MSGPEKTRYSEQAEPAIAILSDAPALWPTLGLLVGLSLASAGMPACGALGFLLSLALSPSSWRLALLFFFAALVIEPAAGKADLRAMTGPVEVVGTVVGHLERDGETSRLQLRTELFRQDSRVLPSRQDLLVLFSFEDEEALASLGWGSRLRIRGLLRHDGGPQNLSVAWPPDPRLTVKSRLFVEKLEEAPLPGRLATSLRRACEAKLARWPGDPEVGGLIKALLLGDRAELPKRWGRTLNALGMVHVLSVSGLHVSLVAVLAFLLTSVLPVRLRSLRLILVALVVVAFVALVGPKPAALRASLMGLLAIAALISARPPLVLNGLAVAAVALCCFEPALLEDLGFRLSLAATFGLVGLGPVFAEQFRRWGWLPPFWRLPLASSLGAELAAGPWIWPLTCAFHPLSPLLDLVLGPWLGLLLLLSGLWLLLPLALLGPFSRGLELVAAPLDLVGQFTRSPWVLLPIPVDTLSAWLPAIFFVVLILGGRRGRILLFGALLLLLKPGVDSPAPPEMIVVDVGQGDAIVLRDGAHALLIDGGGWRRGDIAARILIPTLAHLGIRHLDAVVATHDDEDHCGGLVDLTSYWPADQVWVAAAAESRKGCLARLADAIPAPARYLQAGDRIDWRRWHLETFWPGPEAPAIKDNDRSLVMAAESGGLRVLLTGDIELAAERALRKTASLHADILKVAHHGSKTSSSREFLEAVSPRIAVISVASGNPFGHPNREALDRLEAAVGPLLLRTDRHGLIRFRPDPHLAGGIAIAFAAPLPKAERDR